MAAITDEGGQADIRPGLVLGATEQRLPESAAQVRSDVTAFLRVDRSPQPLDAEDAEVFEVKVPALPGSAGPEVCHFHIRHRHLEGWEEEQFKGEYRTRSSGLSTLYFENGGRTLHLCDLRFTVPAFDPSSLPADEDPEEVAEAREEEAFLFFYRWLLERIDDIEGGSISLIALPELWTAQVHLLPGVWALVAGFCRRTNNRMLVADSAPPVRVLLDEERRRARALGFELTAEELDPGALVPWYREDRWRHRDDIPLEVALTLDAVAATRELLKLEQVTLSCISLYWPWMTNRRGMDLPPSGIVCGVMARSDRENEPVGVKKPPANEPVHGVVDFALYADERPTQLMRREAINCAQTRTGKGILVWGARTLSEDDLWRFINVRRLMGWIGKQIEADNEWAVFENNTAALRETVARDVRYFLHDLREKGALSGDTPQDAYRVACDAENNPQQVRDAGMLMVDVWCNPVQASEFVHLRLTYGDAADE